MANEADWLEDVRRWYFGGHAPEGELAADGCDSGDVLAVGYEAALPGLNGTRWPDALIPGSL